MLTVVGGMARSRLFARILASVLRCEIAIGPSEASARGAAACAARAVGLDPSALESCDGDARFAPDNDDADAYDDARSKLIEAARMATVALPSAATINDAAVVAQVRALASDLLYATGMTQAQVDRALEVRGTS